MEFRTFLIDLESGEIDEADLMERKM